MNKAIELVQAGSIALASGFVPHSGLAPHSVSALGPGQGPAHDTGILPGQWGVLWIWTEAGQTITSTTIDIRMAQSAAGLPWAISGPPIFEATNPAAYRAFVIDGDRRFFQLTATGGAGWSYAWTVQTIP